MWMRSPLPAAASRVFASPMHVGEVYPYWDAVEVSDAATGKPTLAYDLIQQLVCSAAKRVHGSAGHEFVHGVCHWRRAAVFSQELGGQSGSGSKHQRQQDQPPPADVCSTLWSA